LKTDLWLGIKKTSGFDPEVFLIGLVSVVTQTRSLSAGVVFSGFAGWLQCDRWMCITQKG
jgi:hypothetical protein